MKTRSKISLLSVLAMGAVLSPLGVKAEANAMPEPVNGKITLTEDVVLTNAKWLNPADGKVTIDLNGHSLIRRGYYGYLIDNRGELKITGNGNIVCEVEPGNPKNPSSCIRNYGTFEADGIKIKANWTALKNEEGSTMAIKRTEIETESVTAGSILTYGTLDVEDSKIAGANQKDGAAIFASVYVGEGQNKYPSNVNIKNSTISAYWPVIMEREKRADVLGELDKITVNFENSTIKTSNEEGARLLRMQDADNSQFKLELTGNMTASVEALEYLKEGSTLTLNENLENEVTIEKGYTLVVPVGIEVGENIKIEEGAKVVNNSGKELTVTLLGDEEKKVAVKDNETFDGTIPETPENPETPSDPKDPNEENPKTDPEEKPNTPSENPKTLDAVHVYTGLIVTSVLSLIALVKKKLS